MHRAGEVIIRILISDLMYDMRGMCLNTGREPYEVMVEEVK